MFKWIKKIFCCIPRKRDLREITSGSQSEALKSNALQSNAMQFDTAYLTNIIYKETTPFIPQIRFAKVIKVYDGDTITVAAKLPFAESPIYRFSVRLRSIDSPEIRGESRRECQLAIQARDALHKLIFGKIIEIRNNGKEKYGRLLADIYYNDIHINKWMVGQGYAVPYNGGKKLRPSNWD